MTVLILPPELATPDNPRWHAQRLLGITASEIAAVVGLSPWDSPFSLYHRKRNGWETEDNEDMSNGRRLESVICDWWAETQDPLQNLAVARAGLYAHPDRMWQLATPDRLIHSACPYCLGSGVEEMVSGASRRCPDCKGWRTEGAPLAVMDAKWAATWDHWGEPGTDEIPVYYRAQLLWQADVIGVDEWHLAVLGPGGFRAYQGRRDERDLRILRAAGADMMRRLRDEDPPDLDDHRATAAALRKLHPSVEDYDVEVPVALAEGYRRARALRSRVERVVDGYEARIRAAIGSGRRAMCGGRLVASRSVYDQSGDLVELDSLDTDRATVDRLNPGRSKSYV